MMHQRGWCRSAVESSVIAQFALMQFHATIKGKWGLTVHLGFHGREHGDQRSKADLEWQYLMESGILAISARTGLPLAKYQFTNLNDPFF